MTVATLNLRVQPYRLLTKVEAAFYCRLSVKKFEAQCSVKPIKMPNGDLRYDVLDLDKWIEVLKSTAGDEAADAIVARLG
jgi:hypothetical protein